MTSQRLLTADKAAAHLLAKSLPTLEYQAAIKPALQIANASLGVLHCRLQLLPCQLILQRLERISETLGGTADVLCEHLHVTSKHSGAAWMAAESYQASCVANLLWSEVKVLAPIGRFEALRADCTW
eukprot:CAMPEP_0179029534 /NCGR_PEP_ID=MMETSP0796-20121207/10106_1 /TAXON_ID=73915 /ORGANISM="Pyrodinium bahamense, Strain pbaha01" /LENGTH=126 /DNA_ID=CAMNT_0020725701 /DNA_START=173 /DNA_END=554 /DNA_ORIENTATION=-